MKKLLTVLLILCLAFTVFANAQKESAAGKAVKVGYTSYLTGPYAAYMVWSRAGVSMAVNEINAAGGINGQPVELVVKDLGGADVATAMSRLDEMKEDGCVAIMTTSTTNAAQWTSEEHIPVIITNNNSTVETIKNYNKYTFFSGMNSWGISKMIAQETVGKLGYKNFTYIGVDQDCTVDAKNLLVYEGKKINPSFAIKEDYTMNYDDDKYATIISTLMSTKDSPDFILQQGGGATFSGLVNQGNMYNMYSKYDIYTDLTVEASAVQSLIDTNSYPFGHIHGISVLQWWSDDAQVQAWVDKYHQVSKEVIGEQLEPSDSAYYCYLGMKSLLSAIKSCAESGKDFTNADVLCEALCNTKYTDFQGEHFFRDFDHQLTYDAYYVTGVDGGAKFDGRAIGGNGVRYSAAEWLPTKEDMIIYAKQLGYPNRF